VSTYDDNDLGALNRLEDLLDAYCEARLAPRGAVLARIRANVLAEAAAASVTAVAANRLRLVDAESPRGRASVPSRFARTVFALGFAAMLTLGTSLAVLAAPPGSAFYNARTVIETLALPAQPAARLEGHEDLLQERLAEAQDAARRGDAFGLAAALAAYQDEVESATRDAGGNSALLGQLEAMLAKHTDVLAGLALTLPDQSSIDKAIDASSKAITKIQQQTKPVRPSHPPQGGGQDGGNGGAGGPGGQDDQGGDQP
jgi:hypothetical protein